MASKSQQMPPSNIPWHLTTSKRSQNRGNWTKKRVLSKPNWWKRRQPHTWKPANMNWRWKFTRRAICICLIAVSSVRMSTFPTFFILNMIFSCIKRIYYYPTEDEESQKVKVAVFLNISLCHLKLNNLSEARKAVSSLPISSKSQYDPLTTMWKNFF